MFGHAMFEMERHYQHHLLHTSGERLQSSHVGVKGLGGFGSRALHKERFNLRLNGRNLMAGDGLITQAKQL